MRHYAETLARIFAATSEYLDDNGRLHRITDHRAQRILHRGFAEVIRKGGDAVVWPLSRADAACLPGYCDAPDGATWYVAFGLDVDGRGTWMARYGRTPGLNEADERDAIEVAMLEMLAAICNVSGLVEGAR